MVSQSIYAVLILLIIFIFLYRLEYIRHLNNINSISTRIWVNGTRGKSSVTRLIAAGLRAGKKKVLAKTTGTSARIIIDDTTEFSITRLGLPNIREQMKVLKQAKNYQSDIVVLECMALRPDLQRTEAISIVQPTIAVITNVRPDHLDVMGPTIDDIAHSFISALPEDSILFTTETKILKKFKSALDKKNITVKLIQENSIRDKVLKTFSYIEHKENVALALAVCKHLNVDENIALGGMGKANPDPGVLRRYQINYKDKKITIINAMAANDPDSTYRIWQLFEKNFSEINLLINCRSDRVDRSLQLAQLALKRLKSDRYILTGERTDVIRKKLAQYLDRDKILELGNQPTEAVKRKLFNLVKNRSLIFAIGNTVGYGERLIKTFLSEENLC